MARTLLGAACCLWVSVATGAPAGNSGAGDPVLLLEPIATYRTSDAARLACGKDTVVWADRYEGFYYNPREPKYGTTASGAYACQHDAVRGNYWDTSPLSSMAGHPGKSFPFTPLFAGS